MTPSLNVSGSDEALLSDEELLAINNDAPCSSGLPNRAYTSEGFFHWERGHIFSPTWFAIGTGCDIPESGDVRPLRFMGLPLLMCRNPAGQVRVFHNVCSHRGNELVWQAGNVGRRLRCPYHAWTYDLDGNLNGTPHVGGTGVHELEGFCKSGHGLRSIRTAVWMDLVFVNLSGNAPGFDEFIAPLQTRLDAMASCEQYAQFLPARNHGQTAMTFNGNWKLCLENNLEAYHLPWVHPALNSISPLEVHYQYDGGDLFAGQGSKAYDHRRGFDPVFPQIDAWPEGISEYPTLYPNVFLGLHCDHYWTMIIEPVAPDRTVDHLHLYYLCEGAEAPRYDAMRKRRLETWLEVFNEDMGVVEGMQRGRASPAFTGGVFTPVLDQPSVHFAKWMARRLAPGQ